MKKTYDLSRERGQQHSNGVVVSRSRPKMALRYMLMLNEMTFSALDSYEGSLHAT